MPFEEVTERRRQCAALVTISAAQRNQKHFKPLTGFAGDRADDFTTPLAFFNVVVEPEGMNTSVHVNVIKPR